MVHCLMDGLGGEGGRRAGFEGRGAWKEAGRSGESKFPIDLDWLVVTSSHSTRAQACCWSSLHAAATADSGLPVEPVSVSDTRSRCSLLVSRYVYRAASCRSGTSSVYRCTLYLRIHIRPILSSSQSTAASCPCLDPKPAKMARDRSPTDATPMAIASRGRPGNAGAKTRHSSRWPPSSCRPSRITLTKDARRSKQTD